MSIDDIIDAYIDLFVVDRKELEALARSASDTEEFQKLIGENYVLDDDAAELLISIKETQ